MNNYYRQYLGILFSAARTHTDALVVRTHVHNNNIGRHTYKIIYCEQLRSDC